MTTDNSTSTDASTTDRAKETASTAADQGRHVAGTATDEAKNVAAEAATQAKSVVSDAVRQVGGQVSDQATSQRDKLSETLRTFSDDLEQMVSDGPGPSSGLAADLAREVSERVRSFGSHLEGREPGQLLEDARSLARRRPGAFLVGALAAGVVAGRMFRATADGAAASTLADQPGYGTGYTTGTTYGTTGSAYATPGTTGTEFGTGTTYGDTGTLAGTSGLTDPHATRTDELDPTLAVAPNPSSTAARPTLDTP